MIQIVFAMATSPVIAFILLILIAYIQLNFLSIFLNYNPQLIGVFTTKDHILKELKKNNNPPVINVTGSSNYEKLISLAVATTGDSNFYGKNIIASIPNLFVLPPKDLDSNVLLMDDRLLISDVKADDMRIISPLVSYFFVREYFTNRKIASEPEIKLITNKDYLEYREAETNKKLEKIDQDGKRIQSNITIIELNIKNDTDNISLNQSIINKAKLQKDTCLSIKNTSKCKTVVIKMNRIISAGNTNIDSWKKKLSFHKLQLNEFNFYDSVLQNKKKSAIRGKENIPQELGIFEPENKIKINFDNTLNLRIAKAVDTQGLVFESPGGIKNKHAIDEYFATLIHEYLHYASYVSKEKKFANSFFEEGFTEYFARKIVKKNLHVSVNFAYPIQMKIIDQMTRKIPENELTNVYFNKDDRGLEALLDKAFGKNFYKNNFILFQTLMYASNLDESLQLANTILKKIDSPLINKNDLMSAYNSP